MLTLDDDYFDIQVYSIAEMHFLSLNLT